MAATNTLTHTARNDRAAGTGFMGMIVLGVVGMKLVSQA